MTESPYFDCPTCGERILRGSKLCNLCGTRIGGEGKATAPEVEQIVETTTPPSVARKESLPLGPVNAPSKSQRTGNRSSFTAIAAGVLLLVLFSLIWQGYAQRAKFAADGKTALDAVDAIGTIAKSGPSFNNYSMRVDDAQIVVDRFVRDQQQRTQFRDDLVAAMSAYSLAREIWSSEIQSSSMIRSGNRDLNTWNTESDPSIQKLWEGYPESHSDFEPSKEGGNVLRHIEEALVVIWERGDELSNKARGEL